MHVLVRLGLSVISLLYVLFTEVTREQFLRPISDLVRRGINLAKKY